MAARPRRFRLHGFSCRRSRQSAAAAESWRYFEWRSSTSCPTFNALGKKHIVDAIAQFGKCAAADVALLAGVEFGLHLPRMRRKPQDPVSDDDGFLDRMGDEQHRETHVSPSLQQSILHLAAAARAPPPPRPPPPLRTPPHPPPP